MLCSLGLSLLECSSSYPHISVQRSPIYPQSAFQVSVLTDSPIEHGYFGKVSTFSNAITLLTLWLGSVLFFFCLVFQVFVYLAEFSGQETFTKCLLLPDIILLTGKTKRFETWPVISITSWFFLSPTWLRIPNGQKQSYDSLVS